MVQQPNRREFAILEGYSAMAAPAIIEKRSHRRYRVAGEAEFGEGSGDLVNISLGGMLVRCNRALPKGTTLKIRIMVRGFQRTFEADGRVVGTSLDVIAILFRKEPAGLRDLLRWLDMNNSLWIGTG
jgi:c-di-GMP-binding flagellar brake protein YcgR